jgi:alkyl sulfatase BDS1-like metallo-beta-lactamase superfamily hydrolase
MSRRAAYMFGNLLKPGPDGMVGAGLGISTSSGTITLLAPTHLITEPLQKMHIDGLDFEFMLTPDTEAPAEMHWYIEQLRALTAAENWSRTMHNTYTLRGASSRNVKSWSKYLNKTLDHWGHKSDVLYSMHHWPAWGTERIIEQLAIARDGYRYLHDQTLRLANQGYTPIEIAEMIDFPPEIARHWAMRGYYGAINHNVKGIYTRYLGWFDGNPANLHPLPPEESAQKYVALMGGADTVVAKGREAFEAGEYRWVAELAKHVVFAEPQHQGGRELLADAFEQMGYQAESGPWRNFYLTGAMELREGVKRTNVASTDSSDTVRALPVDLFLDYLGIRLNGPKALGKSIAISFHFTDTGEEAVLFLSNGALNHSMGRQDPNADATLTLTRVALDNILLRTSTMQQEVAGGALTITGDQAKVMEIVSLLDTFEFWFNLVTP